MLKFTFLDCWNNIMDIVYKGPGTFTNDVRFYDHSDCLCINKYSYFK